MNSSPAYNHEHIVHRIAWLRAATLGANDGIISIASLLVGMASSGAAYPIILSAGVAGLVAGAASMAAGEWVSVKSQADAEEAELRLEQRHIDNNPKQELLELQTLYQKRGLTEQLAHDVAVALTEHDALAAHAHDELGITPHSTAKPMQAALASALTFTAGGVVPLLVLMVANYESVPIGFIVWLLAASSVITLFSTGALAAKVSNAAWIRAGFRVAIWGSVSMVLSAAVGAVLGVNLH
jgi:vacuolar iron transporter family protein